MGKPRKPKPFMRHGDKKREIASVDCYGACSINDVLMYRPHRIRQLAKWLLRAADYLEQEASK